MIFPFESLPRELWSERTMKEGGETAGEYTHVMREGEQHDSLSNISFST
jgi:hypothetical protein